MHRLTLSAVRRIKDQNGDYIFQPRLSDGLEMRLLGYPVVECDSMPEIAANSASVLFGDFAKGYLIVDRQGVQILRDPYSAKPYVLFYATKRVGGGVSDFNALRILSFSA
jgi:HK97 family phage major capsid protein